MRVDVGVADHVGRPAKARRLHRLAQPIQYPPADVHRVAGGLRGHPAGDIRCGIRLRSDELPPARCRQAIAIAGRRGGETTPGAQDLGRRLLQRQVIGVHGVVGEGVERLPQTLELADAAQGVAVLEQGALRGGARPLQTAQDRLRPRLQADDEAALAHGPPVLLGEDDAAAGSDDDLLLTAGVAHGLPLAATKAGLALLGEDLRDRLARRLLYEAVEVQHPPAQGLGHQGGHQGLAGAREAGEEDSARSSSGHDSYSWGRRGPIVLR